MFSNIMFDIQLKLINPTYARLRNWAREELMSGNRVKASHIDIVADRIRDRVIALKKLKK